MLRSAMSDKQKVLVALALLAETCAACLPPLDQPTSTQVQAELGSTNPALPVIRKDFLSLLTLIYTSTTKVSLTLRPSEPAYTASLTPIRDLTAYVSSLTTCATLFDEYGATLAQDVRGAAKGVCGAVKALADAFVQITRAGGEPESSADHDAGSGQDYLVRTGAVHDLIDAVRGELPENNLGAVRKRWKVDSEMMQDSVGEVEAMLGAGEMEEFEYEEDAEWDELGFGPSKKMSEVEIERAKMIRPLVRQTYLLHKKVLSELLKPSNAPPDRVLDILVAHSSPLLIAAEDLVAALYASQDVSTITSAVSAIDGAIKGTQDALVDGGLIQASSDAAKELEQKMVGVTISEGGTAKKKQKDVPKWFHMCFEMLHKMCNTIHETLDSEQNGK